MDNSAHVLCALLLLVLASACRQSTEKATQIIEDRRPVLTSQLNQKDLELGSAIFIRIFKLEHELEVWVKQEGTYTLFKTFAIAKYSGGLGPKFKEGDRQAPEGFYHVTPDRMNPNSRYHLAFNIGYPNSYDRAHGRTGSFIMVHGSDKSIGCYAMTDERIEEIYTLADAALKGGQPSFKVHCFPFRMTERNMESHKDFQWYSFWENLKDGYDWFENNRIPPNVVVINKQYTFSEE